jgi:hypothetical protein
MVAIENIWEKLRMDHSRSTLNIDRSDLVGAMVKDSRGVIRVEEDGVSVFCDH